LSATARCTNRSAVTACNLWGTAAPRGGQSIRSPTGRGTGGAAPVPVAGGAPGRAVAAVRAPGHPPTGTRYRFSRPVTGRRPVPARAAPVSVMPAPVPVTSEPPAWTVPRGCQPRARA
jgi:hypothetical protein